VRKRLLNKDNRNHRNAMEVELARPVPIDADLGCAEPIHRFDGL
jgi:hypothetical protein